MDFFSGDYISALRGCCALKFLHTLEIHQGLLAHAPSGTGVLPTNFNRENLKFGLKFSLLESITSGLVGVSWRHFFQSTSREAGVIKWAQFLQCPPPKNILPGPKYISSNKFTPELRTFSGDYISTLRGCCTLKFLHALEIHQGLLAQTPSGAVVPP